MYLTKIVSNQFVTMRKISNNVPKFMANLYQLYNYRVLNSITQTKSIRYKER